MSDNLEYEKRCIEEGYANIAGVDEVGRGPLAGPVTVCAVIMPLEQDKIIDGVTDSKKLSNLEKQWAQDAKIAKDVKTENRPRVGQKNAKVQIVAFSDFTCTYCRRAEKTVEQLLKEYSGKVSFVFKNMPLDPQGIAGLASQYFVAISKSIPFSSYLI